MTLKNWFRGKNLDKFNSALGELFPRSFIFGVFLVPILSIAGISILASIASQEGMFDDKVQQFANTKEADADEPQLQAKRNIVVIEVDDATLSWLGTREESRAYLHCLVQRVASFEPKAIGLDYRFGASYDAALVVGRQIKCPDGNTATIVPFDMLSVPVVSGALLAQSRGTGQYRVTLPGPAMYSDGVVEPTRILGFTTVTLGLDNDAVRSSRLFLTKDDGLERYPLPAFALVLREAGRHSKMSLSRWANLQDVMLSVYPEHFNDLKELHLRFRPPDALFTSFPAVSIFSQRQLTNWELPRLRHAIADSYVIIGNTASHVDDRFHYPLSTQTPFIPNFLSEETVHEKLPGVYLHAYILANLLEDPPGIHVEALPCVSQALFFLAPFIFYAVFWQYVHLFSRHSQKLLLLIPLGICMVAIHIFLWRYLELSQTGTLFLLSSVAVFFWLQPLAFTVFLATLATGAGLLDHSASLLASTNQSVLVSLPLILSMFGFLLASICALLSRLMRQSSMAEMLLRHNSNDVFAKNPIFRPDIVDRSKLLRHFERAIACSIFLGDVLSARTTKKPNQKESQALSRSLASIQQKLEMDLNDAIKDFLIERKLEYTVSEKDYLVMVDNFGDNSLNAYVLPMGGKLLELWAGDSDSNGVSEDMYNYLRDQEFDYPSALGGERYKLKVKIGALQILDIPSRVESGVLTASGEVLKGLTQDNDDPDAPTQESATT